MPSSCWLSYILSSFIHSQRSELSLLEREWLAVCAKGDLAALTSQWNEAKRSCATLQAALNKIESLDYYLAEPLREEIPRTTAEVGKLMARAHRLSKELNRVIDAQIHFTNMEAAKLTIKESKSAIACK